MSTQGVLPFEAGDQVDEELGAGDPVEAGADDSALLGLLEPSENQFASLYFPQSNPDHN